VSDPRVEPRPVAIGDAASRSSADGLERRAASDTAVLALLAVGVLAHAVRDVLGAGLVGLVAAHVLLARPRPRVLRAAARLALVAAGVAFAFLPGGDAIQELARFLGAITALALFEGRGGRERGFVFFLTLAQLGLAIVLLPGILVAAILVAGTLALHRALESAHRARAASTTIARGGAVRIGPHAARAREPSSSMRAAHRGALAVLVLGAVLFPVLPRARSPLFALRAPRDLTLAGVGDSIELRALGEIGDLETVIGRATPPPGDDGETPPYLRAAVYDVFDGRTWSSSSRAFALSPDVEPATYVLPTPLVGGAPARWRLEIDAGAAARLPLPELARTLEFATPRPDTVGYDVRSKTVRTRVPATARGVDVVVTAEVSHDPSGDDPPDARDLALPTAVRRDVAPLVAPVTASAPPGRGRAERLTEWLRARCAYATTGAPAGPRPIVEFLTTDRRGHCEFFASALAVCLRLSDIPARVVGGYLPSRWNDVGRFWAIRAGDAHAWTEAWVDGEGWVRLDAVPVGARGPDPYRGVLGFLGRLRDVAEQFWSSHVTGFDYGAQQGVLEALGRLVGEGADGFRIGSISPRDVVVRSLPWLLVAAGGVLVLRRRRRLLTTITSTSAPYRRALEVLRRRGVALARSESPRERVERARRTLSAPGGDAFRRLTADFEAERYGGRRASDPATLRAWLEEMAGDSRKA